MKRPPIAEYRHVLWDTRRWASFEPRPGDIFVCTPAKCGTTWTQTIVAMLLFPDGNLPGPVMEIAPWFDARFDPVDEVAAMLKAQAHRRSIKTHTPADGIPLRDDASYIVVGRDGRDACMSFLNHAASLRPDVMMELAQSAVAGGLVRDPVPAPLDPHGFFAWWLENGSFFAFLKSYWEIREQPNVLFLHYDDLKADLEGQVRRIAAFLCIAIDEMQLPGILQRCSFQWMRDNADRIGELERIFVGGGQSFFYKGTNDRWRDVLTAAELARYDELSRAAMPADLKAWVDRAG